MRDFMFLCVLLDGLTEGWVHAERMGSNYTPRTTY